MRENEKVRVQPVEYEKLLHAFLTRLSYRYKILEGHSSVEYEKLLHASLLHCDSLWVFWLERIERAPLVEGTLVLLLQMFGGTTSV